MDVYANKEVATYHKDTVMHFCITLYTEITWTTNDNIL